MAKRIRQTVQSLVSHPKFREAVVPNPPVESPLGRYLFPSGVYGQFGQVIKLEVTYQDGQVTTYTVEEVE